MARAAAKFVITCAGREFVVTEEVAARFRARAQRIIDSGETGLVPLLHSGGVEMLIIRSAGPCNIATPYEIREL
jgi:hypothetical protein